MPSAITLLHTSPVHCATFDRLRDQLDSEAVLIHKVREDWLEQAQAGGDDAGLNADISAFVASATGPVLCTCSTLGDAAATAGAIRIDAPMMQTAAQIGGKVLLTYVLDSTREPSERLLSEAMATTDQPGNYILLGLPDLWSLFEKGDHEGFCSAITRKVVDTLQSQPDIRVVVLAQASMANAADFLKAHSVVVLSSPKLALQAALDAR